MFRNRGSVPNINIGNIGDNNSGPNQNDGYNAPHYTNYWTRNYIIVTYDKGFFIWQIVAILLFLVLAFGVYLFAYKVSFNDPIAETKKEFLTIQLVSTIATIGIAGIILFFSKNKEALVKRLTILAILIFSIICINLVIKSDLDKTYTTEKFEEFYNQYEYHEEMPKNNKKVNVGLSGVKIVSEKEAYIEQSVAAYKNFKLKTTLYIGIQALTFLMIIFLITKIITNQNKREEIYKDDKVLFDEEQNIK